MSRSVKELGNYRAVDSEGGVLVEKLNAENIL